MWAIVVAGGSGARFGTPKQYADLGGERVLDRSVAVARAVCDGVVVVVPAADAEREGGVAGGPTRSASVANGLGAVPASADVICVHDAARPLASAGLYAAVIDAVLAGADGAVPGVAVTDTIKRVRSIAGGLREVVDTPVRDELVAVQTPQAFRADTLRRAHAGVGVGHGAAATDDASLVEGIGGRVVVVPGEAANVKITRAEDLDRVRQHLATASSPVAG